MLDENICECGHTRDEHGNDDPKMRGSSACQAIVDAKPCECICFEEAEEADEEDDDDIDEDYIDEDDEDEDDEEEDADAE